MSSELLPVTTDEQGSLVMSSVVFAEGLGIQHKNLLESINTHQAAIEEHFGLIAFETRKTGSPSGKGRPENIAHLTEQQALFVGTLSRNTNRVVEFKARLVKSFDEARRQMEPPAPPVSTTEQVLLQLVSQSNQLLANQTELLSSLRADVDSIMAGQRKPVRKGQLIRPPHQRQLPFAPAASLRQLVNQKVNEYCGYHGVTQSETYTYLYKRLLDIYRVDVYRLLRTSGESILDAVERYGHLERVYGVIAEELIYQGEE